MSSIPDRLSHWLDQEADDLDQNSAKAEELLPRLGEADVFRWGVPEQLGGHGGDITDAIAANAAVSEHSLAAGFVAWGHRTFIEFTLRSPNHGLRERLLPGLLSGYRAGASGLSNAMKFLSGIEKLQISAEHQNGGYIVSGKLPWVTNLRPSGFDVAAAIQGSDGRSAFVASLSSEARGLKRSSDLDLMGMQASNTAAVDLIGVTISPEDVLFPDAREWLPRVRPAFLALQCAMSVGLARRSLADTTERAKEGRNVLLGDIGKLSAERRCLETALLEGLRDDRFVRDPGSLFRIRIKLADIVAQAIQFELFVSGGSAYLTKSGKVFQRRSREAAFIPIITPSIVQLRTALEQKASEPA